MMRFELIFVILLVAVDYACAYPPSSIPASLTSPLLAAEHRETGVIISVLSASVGFSRNQLQSRFGGDNEKNHLAERNPDRISFMEQNDGPFIPNTAQPCDNSELYDQQTKKQPYEVAYISAPQDPYLTNNARVRDSKNSQIYEPCAYNNQEISGNSHDNRKSQGDDFYQKNSQLNGGLNGNPSQHNSQVTQATTQSEDYYKRPQNYEYTYNDAPNRPSEEPRKPSYNAASQSNSEYKYQQTSTSLKPHYSENMRIQNDNSQSSRQSHSTAQPSAAHSNQVFRGGYQSVFEPKKSNEMLLHYPDQNPVLTPNQKITIHIEYPTENYSNSNVYTTRAPLKRPQVSRTSSKNPNESSRHRRLSLK